MSNIPEHLKRYIRNQITVDEDALIKLLQDKDKEIEDLKGQSVHSVIKAYIDQLEIKDKEIERLKGLIEKAFDYGVSVVGQYYSPDIYWKGFQEENNLY